MTFEPADRLAGRLGARRAALASFLLVAFFVQLTAWICDDALITLRSVVNFVDGDGISWHAGERAQVFTHPLWFFLLSALHALGVPAVWAAVSLGLACSGFALGLLFFGMAPRGVWPIVAAALLLVGSRGFIDYSTSGLENSLSGLLLLLLLSRFHREDSHRFVAICAGLLLLSRLDSALLLFPILWRWQAGFPATRRRELILWTLLPPLLWMFFSAFYFGSAFPNPYYAKLHADLPRAESLRRGAAYFVNTAWHDPGTALALLLGVFAALRGRGLSRAIGMGICLHCGYVLWIGGDFMMSRFLFLPVVALSAMLMLDTAFADSMRPWRGFVLAALFVAAVPAALHHVDLPDAAEEQESWQRGGGARLHWGIADERRWYAFEYGMYSPHVRWPRFARNGPPRFEETRVIEGGAGLLGVGGTDRVRLLDRTGLVDSFLARLPAERDPMWRIGHAFRALPGGYEEMLRTGEGRIEDPELHRLYARLRLAATAPLLEGARLRAILALCLRGTGPPETNP